MSLKGEDKDNKKAEIYDFSRKLSVAKHFNIEEKNELILETREQGRKLARSILRKWNAKLDLEEVDSVVDLSLCEAVKHFDPKKGVSFITFLYYHLRGNLIRTINLAANKTAIPCDIKDEDLESGFIGKESINPVDVFEAFGKNTGKIPEDEFYKKELLGLTSKACESLDPIEKEIIYHIFLQEEQVTQLAKQLEYSRCHVSRLKTQAIKKLKSAMEDLIGEEIPDIEEDTKESKTKKTKKAKTAVQKKKAA